MQTAIDELESLKKRSETAEMEARADGNQVLAEFMSGQRNAYAYSVYTLKMVHTDE